MAKNVSLKNFEERLARTVAFSASNGLRVMHIQDFLQGGGITVVYRRLKTNSFIEISTAVCSKCDQYNKKIGRILATENFEQGKVIRVPSNGNNPASVVWGMFREFT